MTGVALDTRWLRQLHPGDDQAVTLICLPHAGGSASFFFPLSRALAPQCRVLGVQYPGRQDRHREPVIDDMHTLADRLYPAVAAVARQGPVALFGHSMGAVLGYELAARMRADTLPPPVRLFASGRRAPSRHRDEQVHTLDDPGIVAELHRLGGPGNVPGDPDLLRLALPAIRGDYRAVETYRERPGTLLDCPITVLTGSGDPVVDAGEARRWEAHTTAAVTVLTYPGGHFFLVDHAADVTAVIREALR
ncbi:alpha/beta fold hydrolase [Winogradskya consettensis]|uniref:Oleoyl-ACP hydrolase n=1 Tax=Winogradskya consettensis TaxID=113560 RepID=A0A919SND1_9ACTN|nr:alpha/beta fold hydrolase [Actinoplanes consettensis]GIM76020.1 oleoyl-ACP hydrolase [Actinoplanes consettensis]